MGIIVRKPALGVLLVAVGLALACGGAASSPPALDPTVDPLVTPLPPGVWRAPDAPMCSTAYLLTHFTYQELQGGKYCALCQVVDPMACELDWPFSDVPSCDAVEELRNAIYAYYGGPFTSDRWKARFTAEPWYIRNDAYDDAMLDDVARGNLQVLQQIIDAGQACTR